VKGFLARPSELCFFELIKIVYSDLFKILQS